MSTFVDDLERVVEEVSDWAADISKTVTDLLAPDGRPFGQDKLTEEEQLTEYSKIVGSVEAWEQWITAKTLEFTEQLMQKAVDPEKIVALNPADIITAYAVDYSSRMEKLLRKPL